MRELIEFNRRNGLYDVAEEDWESYVAARIEAVRAGDIPPTEVRRADGKVLQYRCIALPDGGRMLTYFDITELKRAEEALSASLERYDLAMRGSNEALWDWDAASDIIYISPRFKELLGLPAETPGITPAEWETLVHPEDLGLHRQAIMAHLRGHTEFFRAECRVRRARRELHLGPEPGRRPPRRRAAGSIAWPGRSVTSPPASGARWSCGRPRSRRRSRAAPSRTSSRT